MPKSLLLADDSVTIQKAVEMVFRAEDVALTVVSDGAEALARARETKPDLILADVNMPGLGGYELCEKVRADAGTRHIPVLLLGGGTPIDPAKAIAVGANGHMPKPFDSQKLIDQVRQILANPKAVPAPVPKPAAPPPAARPPATPPSRPPVAAPVSRPPTPAAAPGSTITMPRPPTVPGLKPASAPPRPAGAPPGVPRPGGPVPSRPPAAVPPGARPSAPPVARPPAPAVSRPPPPPGLRPPAPPASAAKPPSPDAKSAPPPPPRPERTQRLATPPSDDEIPMEVDDIVEEAPASTPAPLRAVPPPPSSKQQPALSVVPGARGAVDGGEAQLREALSKASREVIEKIAWEVVPELAETIIREELERLMKERGA